MILLIDNYDSFSYNVYQLIGAAAAAGGQKVQVVRNDALTTEDIADLHPAALVLSPGPGRPADAGVCEAAIKAFAGQIPILGICLGHQAICEALGGRVGYAKQLMHGKVSEITLEPGSRLFRGLPERIPVARYHSLAAAEPLPNLRVTARAADGEIMAVEHKEYPVYGLQFHPESVMTPHGAQIISNFLEAVSHD